MDLTEAEVQHALRLWIGNYLCNEQNMEIEESMLFVMDHEDELIGAMEDGIFQHAAVGSPPPFACHTPRSRGQSVDNDLRLSNESNFCAHRTVMRNHQTSYWSSVG
jgi:hypothetical protein